MTNNTEQEPVAWLWTHEHGGERLEWEPSVATSAFTSKPLYAHPVRTKELTDDEMEKAFCIGGCRAVIAADREKNK